MQIVSTLYHLFSPWAQRKSILTSIECRKSQWANNNKFGQCNFLLLSSVKSAVATTRYVEWRINLFLRPNEPISWNMWKSARRKMCTKLTHVLLDTEYNERRDNAFHKTHIAINKRIKSHFKWCATSAVVILSQATLTEYSRNLGCLIKRTFYCSRNMHTELHASFICYKFQGYDASGGRHRLFLTSFWEIRT